MKNYLDNIEIVFIFRQRLFNYNLGAGDGVAGEMAFFDLFETNCTVDSSVDGEVSAYVSTRASDFGAARLAY